MMCGGAGEEQAAHEELQGIVDSIRGDCENKVGKKFPLFRATKFRSQVVAGTNYFVKIDVGDGKFIHVRIFKPLPHVENQNAQLVSVSENHTADDAIEYF